jgi:hypothetical protein
MKASKIITIGLISVVALYGVWVLSIVVLKWLVEP